MSKRCSVVCDTPTGILQCDLVLPDEATIAAVLSAARRVLGDSAADWEHAATGIYGRVYAREHMPEDGDRIELYRPLRIDPRANRRARAAQAAREARAKPKRPGRGPRRA
jgi:putative ubiquitin-RnfH superfamily antitoxin RatB of RatAB toxin-antitoxin module